MKKDSHNLREEMEDLNKNDKAIFKIEDDPRIINGAKFLRNLPQVLRTHPITENRIKNLNRLIPKVKMEYL